VGSGGSVTMPRTGVDSVVAAAVTTKGTVISSRPLRVRVVAGAVATFTVTAPSPRRGPWRDADPDHRPLRARGLRLTSPSPRFTIYIGADGAEVTDEKTEEMLGKTYMGISGLYGGHGSF
jgi:hypothetical protein